MAWEYTSKSIVSGFANIPEARLLDVYHTWVADLIDNWIGNSYRNSAEFTETHSGDGSAMMHVNNPFIQAVSSLVVGGVSYSADEYMVTPYGVVLIQADDDESERVFPNGVGNIVITYTGNAGTVPGAVQLAATHMVSVIAQVSIREGADLSNRYSRTIKTEGEETMVAVNGLQTTLTDIMKKYLPRRIFVE